MGGMNGALRLVASAVLGGIGSVAGGGKFANGAITGAFGYLFNELGANAIRKLYGLRNSIFANELRGHHKFPQALAIEYDELMSPDAVNAAATDRVGAGFVSRGIEGDPHAGYNAAHRAADAAMEDAFVKFTTQNGITKENPMTVEQYYQFMSQAEKIPAVGDYLNSINVFVNDLAQKGIQPKFRGLPRYRGYFAE